MARRTLTIALAATLLLAGCGGATSLLGPGAKQAQTGARVPATPQAGAYLAELSSEQATLAAAEHRIPRQARTPRALAHAIELLHGAITRLSHGLAAVRPPRAVLALHARLVKIVRDYARELATAAALAARPPRELRAVDLLSGATVRATRGFAATIASIDRTLTR